MNIFQTSRASASLPRHLRSILQVMVACCLPLLLCQCAVNEHSMGPVIAKPQSPAHKVLSEEAELTPRLKSFLAEKKYPQFASFQSDGVGGLIILYYLNAKQAYAVFLPNLGDRRKVDIKGPEPVGPKALRMLRALYEVSEASNELTAPPPKQ